MTPIEELERLARAATPGPRHIYTHPRDDNNWQANKDWHEAASPQAFMAMIEQNAKLLSALTYATDELRALKKKPSYRAQTGYVIMHCEAVIAKAEGKQNAKW